MGVVGVGKVGGVSRFESGPACGGRGALLFESHALNGLEFGA